MRISDWSSDVCSSDLPTGLVFATPAGEAKIEQHRASLAEQGDRAGIAQPGVVVGALHKSQPWRSSEFAEHARSEEHTSELQSLMRISYAVFCLKKKTEQPTHSTTSNYTIKIYDRGRLYSMKPHYSNN